MVQTYFFPHLGCFRPSPSKHSATGAFLVQHNNDTISISEDFYHGLLGGCFFQSLFCFDRLMVQPSAFEPLTGSYRYHYTQDKKKKKMQAKKTSVTFVFFFFDLRDLPFDRGGWMTTPRTERRKEKKKTTETKTQGKPTHPHPVLRFRSRSRVSCCTPGVARCPSRARWREGLRPCRRLSPLRAAPPLRKSRLSRGIRRGQWLLLGPLRG